jgi:hypothetical protein
LGGRSAHTTSATSATSTISSINMSPLLRQLPAPHSFGLYCLGARPYTTNHQMKEYPMPDRLMLLPATDFNRIRLLRIPDDYSERDAVRRVTALIAEAQEEVEEWRWEEIAATLEDHGFSTVEFTQGPELG